MITCKICGREIDEPRKAWREAVGWVSPAGAKSMTGEHKTGELAHPGCVSLLRAGISTGQISLT